MVLADGSRIGLRAQAAAVVNAGNRSCGARYSSHRAGSHTIHDCARSRNVLHGATLSTHALRSGSLNAFLTNESKSLKLVAVAAFGFIRANAAIVPSKLQKCPA